MQREGTAPEHSASAGLPGSTVKKGLSVSPMFPMSSHSICEPGLGQWQTVSDCGGVIWLCAIWFPSRDCQLLPKLDSWRD